MFKTAGIFLQRNSPAILTATAIVGVISTTMLAVRASWYSEDILHEDFKENGPAQTVSEWYGRWFKLTWREYLPVYISGAATIACIAGAQSINTKRQGAIFSLYTVTDAALREYQSKVVETIGDRKEEKLRDEIITDRISRNEGYSEVVIVGSETTLCYDAHSGRYFKSTVDRIRRVENQINKEAYANQYTPLNNLYSQLGLTSVTHGDDVGFTVDNQLDIRLSSHLTPDDRPALAISYQPIPLGKAFQ